MLTVANSGEGSRNALYRNLGDGTFRDVAQEVLCASRSNASRVKTLTCF